MIEHTPIFITGCRRSGLSMTAAILHVHGVWSGGVKAQKLQKMSFSNKRLWDDVFVSLLHQSESALEEGLDDDRVVSRIESLLIHQGFRGGFWMLKHHALLLLQKYLMMIFPQAYWVHVRRNPTDILDSCVKTFPLGFEKSEAEWRATIARSTGIMDELEQAEGVYTVRPEKFFTGDFSEMKNFVENVLQLNWMADVVEELFKRS